MNAIFLLTTEVICFALACAATNLAILALRNPLRPDRLRTERATDGLTALCLLGAFAALSFLGHAVFTLVPNLYGGLPLFAATAVIIYMGLDKLMRMSARIAMCDAGRSPFKLVAPTPTAPSAG